MLKAAKEFEYAGKVYKNGEIIPPYTFEADVLQSLIAKGCVWELAEIKQSAVPKGKRP